MLLDLIHLTGKYTNTPAVGANQNGIEVGLAGVVGMRDTATLAELA